MLLIRYKRSNLKPASVAITSVSTAWQIIKGVTSNTLKTILAKPMLGHDIMIERFIKNVMEDKPAPVTPEEGKETVRVMEMIVKKLHQKY
jgi:hypothetical protein